MSTLPPAPLALKVLNFGLYLTLATGLAMVILPDVTQQAFGLMVFQDPLAMAAWPADAQRYVDLCHAVMGSVMIGWATLMRWVTHRQLTRSSTSGQSAYENKPITAPINARLALGASLMLWYIPDTAASLLHGFWENAVFNTGFLITLGLPLLLLRSPSNPHTETRVAS